MIFKTAAFNHSATSPSARKSLWLLMFLRNQVSHEVTSTPSVSHVFGWMLRRGDGESVYAGDFRNGILPRRRYNVNAVSVLAGFMTPRHGDQGVCGFARYCPTLTRSDTSALACTVGTPRFSSVRAFLKVPLVCLTMVQPSAFFLASASPAA